MTRTNPVGVFRIASPAIGLVCVLALMGVAAADAAGPRQDKVQFAQGASSAVIKGHLKGDVTVVKLGDSERYEVPDALLTGG